MSTSKTTLIRACAGILSISLLAVGSASAQDRQSEEAKGEAGAEEAAEEAGSMISGWVQFDGNTNFMSYGADIWGAGNFNDLIFNPAAGIDIELPGGFSLNAGTWWDVNDNDFSNIGGAGIQEVDVWVGLGYSWNILSVSATYQDWMYGGGSERIMDIGAGLDVFLNPSFLVHTRISGPGGVGSGAVFVLGVEEGFDLGPVALSFPVSIGLLTDGYYNPNQGGFGYFNMGVQASYALDFVPGKYGDWAASVGGTYWYTDPTNIGNPTDNIFNMNFGVGVGF